MQADRPNLEIILLRFASHDDVESLVRVLRARLDAAGHILLVLVRVQPHTEGSCVSSQLRLRFRSWIRSRGANMLKQRE